jgi:hypothetical protein
MASADVAFVHRALESWLASISPETSSVESPDGDGTHVNFKPTAAQTKEAAHLGHRLELARITSNGVDERIVELRGRLDRTTRALRRAETDVETARRRLFFATHRKSSLAELPIGEDVGASRSVYDARGDALGNAIRDASRDSERFERLVAGLERRKTLVTDQLLKSER